MNEKIQYMYIPLFNRTSAMDRRCRDRTMIVTYRTNIVLLWLAGMSPREISQKLGPSISTVYRWIRRWQEEGTVETRTHRSRSLMSSSRDHEMPSSYIFPRPQTRAADACPSLQLRCNPQPVCYFSLGSDIHELYPRSYELLINYTNKSG